MVMENRQTFKVFVTKYALTAGIEEVEVEACEGSSGMVKGPSVFEYYHGEGREWHRTRESAVKKAEDMRARKLESLNKQIAKLEKFKFA